MSDLSDDIREMWAEMQQDMRLHVGTNQLAQWERRAKAMEDALVKAQLMIPVGVTECNGLKCRELNCESCWGNAAEEHDTAFIQDALTAPWEIEEPRPPTPTNGAWGP